MLEAGENPLALGFMFRMQVVPQGYKGPVLELQQTWRRASTELGDYTAPPPAWRQGWGCRCSAGFRELLLDRRMRLVLSREIRRKPREKLQLSRKEARGFSQPGRRASICHRQPSAEKGRAEPGLEGRTISGT